jgi:hypothetical protein
LRDIHARFSRAAANRKTRQQIGGRIQDFAKHSTGDNTADGISPEGQSTIQIVEYYRFLTVPFALPLRQIAGRMGDWRLLNHSPVIKEMIAIGVLFGSIAIGGLAVRLVIGRQEPPTREEQEEIDRDSRQW